MTNIDILRNVFDKAGCLEQVWEARFEGSASFITELKFCFENITLVVAADGEYDTIILWLGDFTDNTEVLKSNVSAIAPWASALGLEMRWGWELTNHQGYSDGVRFDFADPDTGMSLEIELIVAGSALHLYLVDRENRLSSKSKTKEAPDPLFRRKELL